jgi:Phospholipase/lecithinase/hemolysin
MSAAMAVSVMMPGAIRAFDALYVIGDSLSIENSGGYAGYYGQGTSNGPMWPEYLSAMLGIDFNASGDVAVFGALTSSLQYQINSLPEGDKRGSLVVLWIGANDVQNVFAGSPTDDTFNQAISNIQGGIESLRALGFRTILVPNVFNLTQTPAYRERFTATERAQQRALIQDFNNRLSAMVAAEKWGHPHAQVRYVNVYSNWTSVLNNAGNYGIIYPFSAGKDDPSFIATGDFSIGNEYGSWDGLHPTTTIHRLLAEWFKAAL